jgi:hypothetical protein
MSLTVYREWMICPVCHENINSMDFMDHTLHRHPYFFVVWASLNMPTMLTPSLDGDDDDDMTYEYLSNLCDMIGYHKVGVTDINQVSLVVDKNRLQEEDICPVCLDKLSCLNECRKISKCQHIFCSDCVEKWLSSNKTCPVCMQSVEEE